MNIQVQVMKCCLTAHTSQRRRRLHRLLVGAEGRVSSISGLVDGQPPISGIHVSWWLRPASTGWQCARQNSGQGVRTPQFTGAVCFADRVGKSPLRGEDRKSGGELTTRWRFRMDISYRIKDIKDTVGSLYHIPKDIVVHLHLDVTTELHCLYKLVIFEFYVTSIDRTFYYAHRLSPSSASFSSFATQRSGFPASIGRY
jgi:hypothetical protein